jgi:hypothetical protein
MTALLRQPLRLVEVSKGDKELRRIQQDVNVLA